MKRNDRMVVPPLRLRDQVYSRLKEDLLAEVFKPGQRLVELDLADRYGVSRTPVREAMARLSREGLLQAHERGYLLPLNTQRDVLDRLETRRLLDAQVARRAARLGEPAEIKALERLYTRELSAHEGGRYAKFLEVHHEFRNALRAMSRNELLSRCATMVDDSFQLARNQLHESAENRAITLRCDGDVLEAVKNHDEAAAAVAVERFIDTLHEYFGAAVS
jgi:DNA-binding GntR family transcriptional regulator